MNWKLAIKLLITVAIVTVISRSVDLRVSLASLMSIPTWSILLVVMGYLLGQVVSAFKWRMLAQAGGISVSSLEALKAYFIGMFVNCFGLGMVGGDVVRGVLISGEKGNRTLGVTSVVADRAHGLAVLAGVGGLSALFFRPDFLDTYLIILLIILGLGVGVGWVLTPLLIERFFSVDSKVGSKLKQLTGMLTRDSAILIRASLLSLVFHLLQISLHWFMAEALGASIPFLYILTTVPFINILGSLPISWNGVGVREAGYIFFFTQQHAFLSHEQAVAMGALWLVAITLSSVVGGMVALLSKDFRMSSVRSTPLRNSSSAL
ncbi:MAG: lysylphosphatidylglycerol synthase transmembrane domain-containing protein [Bdellovibrionota bacterium]